MGCLTFERQVVDELLHRQEIIGQVGNARLHRDRAFVARQLFGLEQFVEKLQVAGLLLPGFFAHPLQHLGDAPQPQPLESGPDPFLNYNRRHGPPPRRSKDPAFPPPAPRATAAAGGQRMT